MLNDKQFVLREMVLTGHELETMATEIMERGIEFNASYELEYHSGRGEGLYSIADFLHKAGKALEIMAGIYASTMTEGEIITVAEIVELDCIKL